MTSGKVTFTFSVRRRELFLPASVLLKCFLDASDKELFHYLVDCSPTVRPLACGSQLSSQPGTHGHSTAPLHRPASRSWALPAYSGGASACRWADPLSAVQCLMPLVMQRSAKEETMVLEAAEAFIKEPSRLGLHSRLAAVAYVGRSFRAAINLPDDLDDIEVSRPGLSHAQHESGGFLAGWTLASFWGP